MISDSYVQVNPWSLSTQSKAWSPYTYNLSMNLGQADPRINIWLALVAAKGKAQAHPSSLCL